MSSDPYLPSEESFGRRKDRRRPKGRRSAKGWSLKPQERTSSADRFDDPGLQHLYERGLLDELLQEIKSGKEANVFLARGPQGPVAAKIYRDGAVRGFSDDRIYRQGRRIPHSHRRKLLRESARQALDGDQAEWIYYEYRQLWALAEAGVRVPRPLVGPDTHAIAQAGRVVLMELIGDEQGPAPRLADLSLEPEEARSAWEQSLDLLVRLLELGKVHGDYSAYNLLWWRDQVVLIDLPQVVELEHNRQAWELLERDVASLCTSFRRHGIEQEPDEVLRAVKARARAPA